MEAEKLLDTTKPIRTLIKESILEDLLNRIQLSQTKSSEETKTAPKVVAKKVEKTNYAQSWFKSYYRGEGDQLQVSHMTSADRFPKIMESARRLKPDAKKILSFGCSTGEECQSLLKYFPDVEQIVGVDLDYYSIASARKKNQSNKILFTDEVDVLGQFDIITVLQTLFCLETPVPKKRWAKALSKIDQHIAPNGIIMIYTSDYDPAEILTADKYDHINVWMREHNKKPGSQYFNGYYQRKDNGIYTSK